MTQKKNILQLGQALQRCIFFHAMFASVTKIAQAGFQGQAQQQGSYMQDQNLDHTNLHQLCPRNVLALLLQFGIIPVLSHSLSRSSKKNTTIGPVNLITGAAWEFGLTPGRVAPAGLYSTEEELPGRLHRCHSCKP